MSRPLAVLDIDGVVADPRHRLHLIAQNTNHEQWVRFFAAADQDPLLEHGARYARQLAEDHDIAWVTGRPERTRELTTRWLAKHHLPLCPLRMQPEGDRRPARDVKLEHLRALQAGHQLAVVIDDDPRVINHLRAAGIPAQIATWLPWTAPTRPDGEPLGNSCADRC